MNNNTQPCANKCSEFKGDQCHHCLIQQIEKREFELGVALEDAYVKCGTSQVIDCTGISSKKVELRFKAGEVVVTASPEFKDGDWVVLANSVSREPSLAQILKIDGRWSIIKWLDDNTESDVRLDFLRHATDEEIAAGRRMDNRVTVITPSGTQKVKGGMVAFVEMGDDEHIENHISPNCRINCFQDDTSMGTRTVDIESENERLKTENLAMQAKVDELQAENKMLHEAAATHLRNQNHFMDLYNRLIEQLYPYVLDLDEAVDTSNSKEYSDGYNRAREIAHYNLLEMMESDVEYIRAQCGMLGGGGEA